LPIDPFKPKVADWRPQLKHFEGRHFLWNSDFALHRLPTSAFYKKSAEVAGEWAIFSYGPDQNYYNQGSNAAAAKGQFIDYDASNGTISQGNILRSQKNGEVFGVDPYFLY
jgi:hypothetical protein